MKLIEITKTENSLQLGLSNLPQWEEFIPWGTQLLSSFSSNSPIDVNEGADRHMLVFTFNRARFSLNYESYCESVWITPEEDASLTQMDALESQLQSLLE